ncbi:glycoside hydrolase family 127 protein [Cellulomonas shaoxiangyii]|uniref:Glycoside hydrolase family 127 protein n=1 Tax=Cellulomonas shaoxiangyii TaxID=2566013 RepID=A0A4P7SI42_9CELL|nr:beta-L-arabinofuranosidase domain-containing protein [Cellulomonas shaoxiangyii]QCB93690.1 glycoside hydrolase family 127 protein [Cellulomonas shaoxiangyii]TGY86171.1 glycoside hydrolase family 127 protein [Cellulomonas shaoxiangyii]
MTTAAPPLGPDRRAAAPVVPGAGTRRGVALPEVALRAGFWQRLQDVNANATLDHCLHWMERLGWLTNFDRVAHGTTGGERPGWQFSDSEVYKLIEALAWEHGRTGDPGADRLVRALTARVAAAQDEDGYLNTCYGHAGQAPRYRDLESGHELYCTGHLLQAAVARLRTHGPDLLVEVAHRAADEVCRTFGAEGLDAVCGHPQIELGLAELGRALGEPRYTDQARLFVERRGHGRLRPLPLLAPSYFQDDVPVRSAEYWRGHAVRALYLTAAAVDVAVDTGDHELLDAVERQWDRSVERRTYITGGMGSRHQDEGFGEDWELPPDRAYCETCAGVASVMVSWRLYLATGDVKYADLMERTFYNVVATSPREDGRAFFYANPLQQRVAGTDVPADAENPRAEGGVRAPWFDVSCCPTNVARTLASWTAYLASVDGTEVTLLQYASGVLSLDLADGSRVVLDVETSYPHAGTVAVRVVEGPDVPVDLRLRVPAWASGAMVRRGGVASAVEPGWTTLDGVRAGERVDLVLPVGPRLTWPDPRIDAVRGCVAVEQGPVVLCVQDTDVPEWLDLDLLVLEPAAPLVGDGDGALVTVRPVRTPERGRTYRSARPDLEPGEAVRVRFGPYHAWAKEPTTMRVFVPVAPARDTD